MTNNKKYYPWIVVALLWGVALLNYMDRQMLSTMKSAMMIDITELESATNFGRLMAVFLWIYHRNGMVYPRRGQAPELGPAAEADRAHDPGLVLGMGLGQNTRWNHLF